MPTAVITGNRQVTIPKAIWEQIRLCVGDRVTFVVRGGEIVIKPLRSSLLDLQGSAEAREHPEDFDRVRESVKRHRAEKLARSE